MQTYTLNVKDRRIASASEDSTLVRTSKGIDKLRVESEDSEWLDYDLSVALSIGGSIVEIEIAPTETGTGWHAELDVPDSVLEHDGPLGVTLHGTDSGGHHIITAKAVPLVIEHEGDVFVDLSIAEVDDYINGTHIKSAEEHSYYVKWTSFAGNWYNGFILNTKMQPTTVTLNMTNGALCSIGLCTAASRLSTGNMVTSSVRSGLTSGTYELTPTENYPHVFVRVPTWKTPSQGTVTVTN